MSFKTRIKKKSPVDNRVTLQAKHNQKCEYFNKKKDNLINIKNYNKCGSVYSWYKSKNVIKNRIKLTVNPKIKIIFVKERNEKPELAIATISVSETSLFMA